MALIEQVALLAFIAIFAIATITKVIIIIITNTIFIIIANTITIVIIITNTITIIKEIFATITVAINYIIKVFNLVNYFFATVATIIISIHFITITIVMSVSKEKNMSAINLMGPIAMIIMEDKKIVITQRDN